LIIPFIGIDSAAAYCPAVVSCCHTIHLSFALIAASQHPFQIPPAVKTFKQYKLISFHITHNVV
jgi:hypothetical protein